MNEQELEKIAGSLVSSGKGILAADESTGTIKKRFDTIGVESTPENHRIYRQLLFKTEGVEKFISGVIMFDETINQVTDEGILFAQYLLEKGIIPGIKVDEGAKETPELPNEKITEGLDGLEGRLIEYKKMGAKFTKWRAVITVGEEVPSELCIEENAKRLAEFAYISQKSDLVPIVEPEVLMDGAHNIEKSEEVIYKTLKEVFSKLSDKKIFFKGMLLKPSWVHPGKERGEEIKDEEIAERTIRIFKSVLPDKLPGVVFLSGGDSPEDSTRHLNAINAYKDVPWQLSFSFGRALQQPVLELWKGNIANIEKAQAVFYKRARLNSLAREGKYSPEMENI